MIFLTYVLIKKPTLLALLFKILSLKNYIKYWVGYFLSLHSYSLVLSVFLPSWLFLDIKRSPGYIQRHLFDSSVYPSWLLSLPPLLAFSCWLLDLSLLPRHMILLSY